MSTNEQPAWAETLFDKLEMLIKQNENLTRIQRFAGLGPDKVVTINHLGQPFDIHVPFGDVDYIQRVIIMTRGFFEAALLKKLTDMNIVKPGGVIVDAGANIGNHSVYFGHYFKPKRMYCFEPQTIAAQTCKKNVTTNLKGVDVRIHQVLLGEQAGMGAVSRYLGHNHGGASFVPAEDGDTPMVSLDEVVTKADQNKITFMKIDVERTQDAVLRGASSILQKSRPILWIEVFADERPATDALMAEFGYRAEVLHKSDVLYFPTD